MKKIEKFTKLRLKSINDGILRVGPDFIRIGVSRSCNFNCIMCWNHSPLLKKPKSAQWKNVRIEKDMVFKILDEAEKMGVRGVLFSGAGEPFTHPDMTEFLETAKRKGFRVRIQTNLSLASDADIESLIKLEIDVIAVNLCAASAGTYIKIHPNQKKKDYEKILKKIAFLREKVAAGVEIRMTDIITKLNYKEIVGMAELACRMDASLHLELADFSSGSGVDDVILNDKEKKEVIKETGSLDERYKEYKKSNLPAFLDQITYSGIGFKKIDSCLMGYVYAFINESGEVFPCNNAREEFFMGNLKSRSLEDIWFSEKFNNLRKQVRRGDFPAACRLCLQKLGRNFKTRFFVDSELCKKVLSDTLINDTSIEQV